MGMVVCHSSCFILAPTLEQPPAGGKDGDESDDKSGSESSLSSAAKLLVHPIEELHPVADSRFKGYGMRFDNLGMLAHHPAYRGTARR